jgi:insertion element IS1 protein InsB
LSETLIEPDATDAEAAVPELNELWSFALKKTCQAWIWFALCRKTRQLVAYAVGDRSEQTCRRLWEAIPPAHRAFHCTTDFWPPIRQSFQKSSTPLWERKPGKPLIWSAGITRFDNIWLVFVRKTLSFSKSLLMHKASLNLFLHRYNRERAIMLM